jgi:HD-GYP domain-containing protein (c-di-GMP phosphodiesterase class II)
VHPLSVLLVVESQYFKGSPISPVLKARTENIHEEAKIIAVADTVEAIAHHRPYRPAIGLKQAIRELRDHRETKYDVGIVDSATALLSEKRFVFE